MDVQEIIKKYLTDNGFDGLANEECDCEISDLAPCNDISLDCIPGYKVPCLWPEVCPVGGGCPWHISTKKPKERK